MLTPLTTEVVVVDHFDEILQIVFRCVEFIGMIVSNCFLQHSFKMFVAKLLVRKLNVDFIITQKIGISLPYLTKAVVRIFAWPSFPSFLSPSTLIPLLLLLFFFFFSSCPLLSNLHSSSNLFIIKLQRLLSFINFFHNCNRRRLIPDFT